MCRIKISGFVRESLYETIEGTADAQGSEYLEAAAQCPQEVLIA